MFKKVLTAALFMGIVSSGYSADDYQPQEPKTVDFANDQTVYVELSMDDVNRVFVEGDKFKKIYCKDDLCKPEQDPIGGMYLSLGVHSEEDKVTMFAYTMDGRQFTVVITPIHDLGQTVKFIPLSGGSSKALKIEKNTPYDQMLSRIITGMINYQDTKKIIDGFSVIKIPFDPEQAKLNKSDVLAYASMAFKGGDYMGLQFTLKNQTTKRVPINPKMFYRDGALAGAVSKDYLEPGEIGYLYQVSINK
mgnify:CR=1 FL=1